MKQVFVIAATLVLVGCVGVCFAQPNNTPRSDDSAPYELILNDEKITFEDPEKISIGLLVRDLGLQEMIAPDLYWGLSIVWDGKEYKRDPKHVGDWNGPNKIIPKTAWRTGFGVTEYQIPAHELKPGKHTVSLKDKWAQSNTLTVFIDAPNEKNEPAIVLPTLLDMKTNVTEDFERYLATCPENQIRCIWFLHGHLRTRMKMAFNLKNSTVYTARDVFSWAVQNSYTRTLGVEQLAALKNLIKDMPESSASNERSQLVFVSFRSGKGDDEKVEVKKYLRSELPDEITRIYDIGGDLIDTEPKEKPSRDDLREFMRRLDGASFERALLTPNEFPLLAEFLSDNPAQFADMIARYDKKNADHPAGREAAGRTYKLNKASEWTDYLHARIEQSSSFARQAALGWKQGWSMTAKDVVPRLSTKGFPSTRRIAIEFLKLESHGDDFGFEWQVDPSAEHNAQAIKKWTAWLQTHKTSDNQ